MVDRCAPAWRCHVRLCDSVIVIQMRLCGGVIDTGEPVWQSRHIGVTALLVCACVEVSSSHRCACATASSSHRCACVMSSSHRWACMTLTPHRFGCITGAPVWRSHRHIGEPVWQSRHIGVTALQMCLCGSVIITQVRLCDSVIVTQVCLRGGVIITRSYNTGDAMTLARCKCEIMKRRCRLGCVETRW